MKKNTGFLKAADKAAELPAVLPACGLLASASPALAGYDNGTTGNSGGDGGI